MHKYKIHQNAMRPRLNLLKVQCPPPLPSADVACSVSTDGGSALCALFGAVSGDAQFSHHETREGIGPIFHWAAPRVAAEEMMMNKPTM